MNEKAAREEDPAPFLPGRLSVLTEEDMPFQGGRRIIVRAEDIRAFLKQVLGMTGGSDMGFIGNVIWFIFGGFFSGMAWILSGLFWCLTLIGIPYGLQCFKFASLSFSPFGKEVVYGDGAVSFLVNVIWCLVFGWWMALINFLIGCLWCVTIIGIPFGKQFFKIAKLALAPFGAEIIRNR